MNKKLTQLLLEFQTLLNPENGYIKDDTIKLEVTVMADAPHGVQ